MKLGAHVSASGGYSQAVRKVSNIGGDCLQIFSTSPRGWRFADPDEAEVLKFKEATKRYSVYPTYFHASYLINLAGSEDVREKSVSSMIAELNTASRFGIKGTVVHLGSFKKGRSEDSGTLLFEESPEVYKDLFESIKRILNETPKETLLIIENMGTRKIGKSLEEIAYIIEKLSSPRLRVCLDTCHLHAAGIDLSTEDLLNDFIDHFDKIIGISLLEFFHINDSRDEFGSLRDRHENIGEGKIPKEVFSLILNHPKLKKVPFITEVPGFDGNGPDKKNINILKSLKDK